MTAEETIVKLERKIGMMRCELLQYRKDLDMWQLATGSEYPLRRREELIAKMEEIENL